MVQPERWFSDLCGLVTGDPLYLQIIKVVFNLKEMNKTHVEIMIYNTAVNHSSVSDLAGKYYSGWMRYCRRIMDG